MRWSLFIIVILYMCPFTRAQDLVSPPGAAGPGPLFAIGQNIIPKHYFIAGGGFRYQEGPFNHSLRHSIGGLYGITDRLVALFVTPFILTKRSRKDKTRDVSDFIFDLEYAFFQEKGFHKLVQATIIGGLRLPTSDITKKPAVSFGTYTFLLGMTASYLDIPWYFYFSAHTFLPKKIQNIKLGNFYLYECGIGYKLITITHRDYVSVLIEANGIFEDKSKKDHTIIPNTGGNTVFIGPVIRLDWRTITIQAGIQFPILQKLFGDQDDLDYRASLSIAGGF